MSKRFANRQEVECFLLKEFANHNASDVLTAFSWAFFDGGYERTPSKKSWSAQHNVRQEGARTKGLNERLDLERIWHENNPKTGGADPADYFLADWVKMGFEDLGESVTFGVSGSENGVPSTRFGRVVQAVLDWRHSTANWRRIAERSAKKSNS